MLGGLSVNISNTKIVNIFNTKIVLHFSRKKVFGKMVRGFRVVKDSLNVEVDVN